MGYTAKASITIYDTAPEMTKAEADLREVDQNKYYPVCFYLIPNSTYSLRYRIRIRRVLNASHGTVDFSAHANKAFALAYEWEVNPSGWGSSPIDRRVHIYSASLVKAGEAVASHPDQYIARSVEFVYLRGGSRYLIEVEGRNDLRVEAYPRGVTLGEDLADRYQLTLAPLDSIADRLPKTDIEAVEERVAREYIKTAEHNAKIADLQRQIDGEISNWFGAGVPTPSGYPADQWTTPQDKQRHIGDTFTTTDNFPLAHAGKSWRWMGTAWTEIADSDAIRALNAAREARATADGKTTTYLSRPSAYQLGDSWVLSTDQQVGSTQYTRGTILFATASSATFNASHWVRYDTYITEAEAQKKVDEVQIGTRNLVLASGTTHDKTDYLISRYTLSEQWQVGQTYSISIWAEIYGNPTPSYYAPVMVIYPDRGSRAMGRAVADRSIQMTDGAYRGVWTLTGVFTSTMASSTSLGDGKQLGVYLLGNSPATVRCVIKRISVVNGNRPPLDWAPAPEDVADEAYNRAKAEIDKQVKVASDKADEARRIADAAVTQAQADGKVTEAEARALAATYETYRQTAISEWEKLLASYSHTYGNTYLTGQAQSDLSTAHTTARNSYNALMSRLASTLGDSKVVASEIAPLRTAIDDYKTKTTGLRTALEVADKAIQAEILRRSGQYTDNEVEKSKERTKVTVDTRGLDENKYYPLVVKLIRENTQAKNYRLKVSRPLNASMGVPEYAQHTQGFTLDLEWSVKASDWGAMREDRRIYAYSLLHTKAGEAAVSSPLQVTQISAEYVYIRGGSSYEVEVYGRNDLEIAVHPEGFTQGSFSIPVVDSIAGRLPVTDIDSTKRYADGKAEDAYKKAQAYLDADYLRKVIKEGKTTIEGGLLATNVIALSPAEGGVSAYVNGDPTRRIAFGAGVSGFGTPQERRIVEIMHDGNASLGDVHIRPEGRIEFKRPSDEGAYMTIGGEIGALSSLISKSADVITSVVQQGTLSEAFTGTDEHLFPTTYNGYQRVRAVLSSGAQRATVGMKIRTRGQVELHVNSPELVEETGGIGGAGGFSPSLGGHTLTPLGGLDGLPTPPTRKLGNTLPGSISVSLALKVGGVSYPIGTYDIATSKTETFNVDHTRMVDTEGAVTLEATITSWLHNRHQSASVTLRGFTLSGEKRHEEFNNIHFAPGGAVYLYSADRYVYISKTNDNVMSIGGNVLINGGLEVTGAVTMSGSLARGEVSKPGSIVWCSGPRAKPPTYPINGFAELLNDKTYKVYHNIGHTKYSISIMPYDTRDVPTYIEKATNYVRIAFKAPGDNSTQTHAFTYSLEGDL